MHLFGFHIGRDIIAPEVIEPEQAPPKKVAPAPRLIPYKVNNRIKSNVEEIMERSMGRNPDSTVWDYDEIRRVEDKESYLGISFRKHIEMIMKRGWTVHGNNPDFVNHVRTRLWEIFILTGISTQVLMRALVADLVRFSNAYLVVKRSGDFPISGKSYTFRDKEQNPIVGMFRADPSTMVPMFDTKGKLHRWKNMIISGNLQTGSAQYFKIDDVFHLKWNDKGLIIGTPFVIPVLDDIRALRRIEEFVELLASKHAFPLYHYQVGTENSPAEVYAGDNGTSEVETVAKQVEAMPTEGSWVTSERHKITAVGAEGKALDLTPYLQHFEARVISGVGLSGVSLGRGSTANRNTASSMDKTLIDRAADIQTTIMEIVASTLLFQLHLDSGKPFGPDDMAMIYFPSPDAEEERAHENHVLNQYNGNVITEDEMRDELKRPPFTTDQDKDRQTEHVDVYTQRRMAELAKEFGYITKFPGVTPMPVPAAGGGGSAKPKASTAAKKSTAVSVRPRNQSGTKSTKTRATRDAVAEEIRDLKYTFASVNDKAIDINIDMALGLIHQSFLRFGKIVQNQVFADIHDLLLANDMAPSTVFANKCYKSIMEKHLQSIEQDCIIRVSNEDSDLFPIFEQAGASLTALVDNLQRIYEDEVDLRGHEDGRRDEEVAASDGSSEDPSGCGGREEVPPVHGRSDEEPEGAGSK